MKVTEFKKINKNTLVGIATIEKETPHGIEVTRGIKVFSKDNSKWISTPSETYEKDGQKKYYAYIFYKPSNEKFQADFFKALEEFQKTSDDLPF